MLVLPIVNKKRVMNVQLEFKNKKKIKQGVLFSLAGASDIIVNREKFSDSSFYDSKDEARAIDFIRSKSILYPRKFLVTTKALKDGEFYDVYEVCQPPKKVNDCLDKLYSKTIIDLKEEMPKEEARGRYVSFEKLGFDKFLTDEKIAELQRIVREERDIKAWPRLFQEAGVADLSETLDFLSNFEFTVVPGTSISEESLVETLKALSVLKTRDYKYLNKYYMMAKSNAEVYTKISYINKILYDKPLYLIQSKTQKEKSLIKKIADKEYSSVA